MRSREKNGYSKNIRHCPSHGVGLNQNAKDKGFIWQPPGSSVHGILQAQILEWATFLSLRDLPNLGSNLGLLHFRQIFYHLSQAGHLNSKVYMYYNFFIHSSVGHLVCFHVMATVNSAAMNIGLYVSFCIVVFSGYILSSGIAGS